MFVALCLRSMGTEVLYELLRPELVRTNTLPLSSDSCTRWGSDDAAVHNAEVADACKRLYETQIPAVAAKLDAMSPTQYSPAMLKDALHAAGVNMRHLGKN